MDIVGSGDRLKARWKALKRRVTGTSRTRQPAGVRTTRLGTETVSATPAMRRALPANQPPARGQSTAARPVRCGSCQGYYGRLKSGRPRAHNDVRTGRPCPGGGAPRKPRAAS